LDPRVVGSVDKLADHIVGLVEQTGNRGTDQQTDLDA
jgi:hypothetical protein